MDKNIRTRLQAYFSDFVDDTGALQSISLYDLREMKKELTSPDMNKETSDRIKELEIIICMLESANIEEKEYIQFL